MQSYGLEGLKRTIGTGIYRLSSLGKPQFHCPLCLYRGPFKDVAPETGLRLHALCPNCGALERHRLQFLVIRLILEKYDTTAMTMLHFAPEAALKRLFEQRFRRYETADLFMTGVDHRVDIEDLPFDDSAYDLVYASHVLEHIRNDVAAIKEIRRVLKPGGFAVLPVPLVSEKTIEYPEPNPHEAFHVRAPGRDYFDRLSSVFSRMEAYSSEMFSEEHQLFVYEDRTRFPSAECPLRPAMHGERHMDVVPICFA